jgi:hypothetical protein
MVHTEVFIIQNISQQLCYTGTQYSEHMFNLIYLNYSLYFPQQHVFNIFCLLWGLGAGLCFYNRNKLSEVNSGIESTKQTCSNRIPDHLMKIYIEFQGFMKTDSNHGL